MSNTNDFSKCKVGEKLWCLQLGECTVNEMSDHLIKVSSKDDFCSFFLNGVASAHDKYQSLFFSNPNIIAPPEPKQLPEIPVGTLLLVWDEWMDQKKFGRFIEWNRKKVIARVGIAISTWDNWELAPETIRIRELEAELAKLKEMKELVEHLRGFRDEPVMQEDGWIPFTATEDSVCPVDPETKVRLKLESGKVLSPELAGFFNWRKIFGNHSDQTIVAYKVVG